MLSGGTPLIGQQNFFPSHPVVQDEPDAALLPKPAADARARIRRSPDSGHLYKGASRLQIFSLKILHGKTIINKNPLHFNIQQIATPQLSSA
jgi:hypothetical protein